ncbi:MAG: hypothetical protein HYU69_10545 [Bacteroidetes bacterium]|nr:hypothetical protein [Bacteroidota bacterium]
MIRTSRAVAQQQMAKQTARDKRKMILLRRKGLFASPENQGFEIKRAFNIKELLNAYRIVHDIFVEQGFIKPYRNGMRIRPFEFSKQIATFIACAEDNKVQGVLSLVQDSNMLGLPSDGAFFTEISQLRKQNRRIAEVTNQAIVQNHRSTCMTTQLMQTIIAQALLKKNTDLIIAISPSELNFYNELMTFECISDIKSYSKEINDPVVLMRLDIEQIPKIDSTSNEAQLFAKRYLIDNNPYILKVGQWEEEARFAFDVSFF